MQAWVNNKFRNLKICHFKASLLLFQLMFVCSGLKEYFMVTRYSQVDIPREVSHRGQPGVGPVAADVARDICLTVSHNHNVFLFSITKCFICNCSIASDYTCVTGFSDNWNKLIPRSRGQQCSQPHCLWMSPAADLHRHIGPGESK